MKTSNHLQNWALALLAFSTLNSQFSTPASAANVTVNSLNDSGGESLREAIQTAANGDTINFSVTGVITLTNGELLISKSLTINGPGAASLSVSGNANSRVFFISSGVMTSISGLTIHNGHADNSTSTYSPGQSGGGVYNAGSLTLSACAVASNSAGSGAIASIRGGNGGNGGSGGGIYNAGALTLSSCTVNGNSAGGGGEAGLGSPGGLGGAGGGIYNAGTLRLNGCTFSGNTGGIGGIGGSAGSEGPPPGQGGIGGSGGGLFNTGT